MARIEDKRKKPLSFLYVFKFQDGQTRSVKIDLSADALQLEPSTTEPPEWAALGFHQCDGCALDSAKHEHCPVALNLAPMVKEFSGRASNDPAFVCVYTARRDYSKSTSLQDGLSSLFGIVMTTSGCPAMDYLRPLVRYHQPFATMHENVFRTAAMYLLMQFARKRRSLQPDWEMRRFEKIYTSIHKVNEGIARRLKAASGMEAPALALTKLDQSATLVPFLIDELLEELGPVIKKPYLED